MKCPSCGRELEPLDCEGIVAVDVCTGCAGVWFDKNEMPDFIKYFLCQSQDVPEAKIELDKKAVGQCKIAEPTKPCPRCQKKMSPFNYAYDSNIILDRCPHCDGIWADPGEVNKLAVFARGNKTLEKYGRALLEEHDRVTNFQDITGYATALCKILAWKAGMRGWWSL